MGLSCRGVSCLIACLSRFLIWSPCKRADKGAYSSPQFTHACIKQVRSPRTPACALCPLLWQTRATPLWTKRDFISAFARRDPGVHRRSTTYFGSGQRRVVRRGRAGLFSLFTSEGSCSSRLPTIRLKQGSHISLVIAIAWWPWWHASTHLVAFLSCACLIRAVLLYDSS